MAEHGDKLSIEQERRRHLRGCVPVEGAGLLTLVRESGGRWEYEECRLLEVSPRGLRFRTTAPVRDGERLRLILQPLETAAVTATVEVHVLWASDTESGYRDIGVKILAVDGTPPLDESYIKESETMTNHLEQDRQMATRRLEDLLGTEHWLGDFMSALLGSFELNGAIEFSTVEKLLATEKEEFERDLAIARKMFRLYPGLLESKPAPESKPDAEVEPPEPQSYVAAP